MNKYFYYSVANVNFAVNIPEVLDINKLLPSFIPFASCPIRKEECAFVMNCVDELPTCTSVQSLQEENENELGHVWLFKTDKGYRCELKYTKDGALHCLDADDTFSRIKAKIDWKDPYADIVLSSFLRIVFSQVVLSFQGISVHAAAVVLNGEAYLFMGKSGTGKSTHAALWQDCFLSCMLLNDDNPVIRWEKGNVWAYGTPWSGKTPCYKNLRYPLRGLVRLKQAGKNEFVALADVDAFVAVLSGCSAIHEDENLQVALCDNLVRILNEIMVGFMYCKPDKEAAIVCACGLKCTNIIMK